MIHIGVSLNDSLKDLAHKNHLFVNHITLYASLCICIHFTETAKWKVF